MLRILLYVHTPLRGAASKITTGTVLHEVEVHVRRVGGGTTTMRFLRLYEGDDRRQCDYFTERYTR